MSGGVLGGDRGGRTNVEKYVWLVLEYVTKDTLKPMVQPIFPEALKNDMCLMIFIADIFNMYIFLDRRQYFIIIIIFIIIVIIVIITIIIAIIIMSIIIFIFFIINIKPSKPSQVRGFSL